VSVVPGQFANDSESPISIERTFIEHHVKGDQISDIELPIICNDEAKPGTYEIKFAFFNHRDL